MRKIEIIKTLEKYPLFTFNEFVRIIKKTQKYARTYLYRLKKERHIFQVERSKYTVFDDPMIISSHIMVPSYISFWTAIRLHDLTEQLPADIMIAVPRPKKTIEFQGIKLRFFKIRRMYGYKKQRYRDFDIFVAEREKCIIDSLLLQNTPFDEVVKAIKTKNFDAKKLIEYAIKTGNKSLIKRLGHLMESFGMKTEKFARHLDNNYILLDWNGTKEGKKSKKWKIIVNRRSDDIY